MFDKSDAYVVSHYHINKLIGPLTTKNGNYISNESTKFYPLLIVLESILKIKKMQASFILDFILSYSKHISDFPLDVNYVPAEVVY